MDDLSRVGGYYQFPDGALIKTEINQLKVKADLYTTALQCLSRIPDEAPDDLLTKQIQMVRNAAKEVQQQAQKVNQLVNHSRMQLQLQSPLTEGTELQKTIAQSKLESVIKISEQVKMLAEEVFNIEESSVIKGLAGESVQALEKLQWPLTSAPSLGEWILTRLRTAMQWVGGQLARLIPHRQEVPTDSGKLSSSLSRATVIAPTPPQRSVINDSPFLDPSIQQPTAVKEIVDDGVRVRGSRRPPVPPLPPPPPPSDVDTFRGYLTAVPLQRLTEIDKSQILAEFEKARAETRKSIMKYLGQLQGGNLVGALVSLKKKDSYAMLSVLDRAVLDEGRRKDQLEEPARTKQQLAHEVADVYFAEKLSSDFQRVKCADDGDCLYHAFSGALTKHPLDIRKELSEYMKYHRKRLLYTSQFYGGYADLSIESGPRKNQKMDETTFLAEAEQVGKHADSKEAWGELRHVRLLAELYNKTISIHCPDESLAGVYNQEATGGVVHLFYNGSNHWDLLRPKRKEG